MENRNTTVEKNSRTILAAGIALLIGVFCSSAHYNDSLQFIIVTQIPEPLIWEISGGIVVIVSLFGLKRHYADDDKITSEL